MNKVNLIATAAFGIESVVGQELKRLGFDKIQIENGRVQFESDLQGICTSNLWVRCADRIFLKVAEFKATTFEQLFDQVNALPWEDYLGEDAAFPVNAKSVKSKLFSLSDIQSISKKAIVKKLQAAYKIDWFEESGPKYPVLISILKDTVTVSIDTSGAGLHKRGYREQGNEAPLRETLAAALVYLSNWRGDRLLVDPMCGTGTILIEAAMMARHIAPGLNRRFVSESWPMISVDDWKEARKKAYEAIDFDAEIRLIGYDMSKRAIMIARENAEKAGVEDDIHFQVQELGEFSTQKKYGYIISNPPYGERLSDKEQVEKLYTKMGQLFLSHDTWSTYFITSHEKFETCYGKKATKNRKLYNGKIKCYFYQYHGPRPPKKIATS